MMLPDSLNYFLLWIGLIAAAFGYFIYPNMTTGRKRIYPIIRPLFYYYTADNSTKVMPFIRFLLSPRGQQIVMKCGYVPLK